MENVSTTSNPYPPGSDEWHRFNLGIDPKALGVVSEVKVDDGGVVVKGWWFGDALPRIQDISLGMKAYENYEDK